MPMRQLKLSEAVVMQLNGRLRTLDRYRRSSVAAHNEIKEPVRSYARGLLEEAEQIQENFPGDQDVENMVSRIRNYMTDYKLRETTEKKEE